MSTESSGAPFGEKRAPDLDPDPPPLDKRIKVSDEEVSARTRYHTIGIGSKFLPSTVPTDSLPFLKRNGYFLHETQEKCGTEVVYLTHLCRDMRPLLLEAGPLNMVFLDDYVQWSGGLIPSDKIYSARGGLAHVCRESSSLLRTWLDSLDISGEAADAEIVRMFRSDQVVKNKYPGTLKVNFGKQPCEEGDFIHQGEVVLPEYAGYWRLDFPEIEDVLSPIPTKWKKALDEKQFSYKYFPNSGVLFFSNTLGAKYGLPPTAKHLGLPKLIIGTMPQPTQVEKLDGCCPDCLKNKEEVLALQRLAAELLSRKKTLGSFSFPAGFKKFSVEGDEIGFEYKGKVIVKK